MDPGKAHKVSQSVRVVTWHVDVDVGDLVVESRAIALDKEFDNAFAARWGKTPPPAWRRSLAPTRTAQLQQAHPGVEGIK